MVIMTTSNLKVKVAPKKATTRAKQSLADTGKTVAKKVLSFFINRAQTTPKGNALRDYYIAAMLHCGLVKKQGKTNLVLGTPNAAQMKAFILFNRRAYGYHTDKGNMTDKGLTVNGLNFFLKTYRPDDVKTALESVSAKESPNGYTQLKVTA